MTKEEFLRWKHDGKEVWSVFKKVIEDTGMALAHEAGQDQMSDRYKAGVIKGIELVLEVDWEDQEDAES